MSTENNINVNNTSIVSDLEFVNELEKLDLSTSDYKTKILDRMHSVFETKSFDNKMKRLCLQTSIVMTDEKSQIKKLFIESFKY